MKLRKFFVGGLFELLSKLEHVRKKLKGAPPTLDSLSQFFFDFVA